MNEFLREALFLPAQGSTYARNVDWLHYFIILTTFFGSAAVTVVGGFFVIRFRRSRDQPANVPPRPDRAPPTPPHVEIALIGLLVFLFFFWWILGMRLYTTLRVAPPDALRIYVTAKQWMWKFQYTGGQRSIARLYVPARRPIELVMISRDVIHSFYVPDFRQKMDVLPGRFTSAWFEAKEPGHHQILCAEYCGTGHSKMWGEVIALDAADFDRWLAGEELGPEITGPAQVDPSGGQPASTARAQLRAPGEMLSLAAQGRRVAAEHGCLKCHTLDGTPHIGPTWRGLYRRTVALQDGAQVVADDAYLTESMMDPMAKLVAGFEAKMPSFEGQLSPPESAMIIELIRSLERGPAAPDRQRPGPSPIEVPTPARPPESEGPP